MIFPFHYGYADDDVLLAPDNQQCTSCGEPIAQDEKSIHFGWGETADLYFHVKCAEHVALMMMRDVAECRCGREAANARYRQVRKIIPHP